MNVDRSQQGMMPARHEAAHRGIYTAWREDEFNQRSIMETVDVGNVEHGTQDR
jgi:hypothetical protein